MIENDFLKKKKTTSPTTGIIKRNFYFYIIFKLCNRIVDPFFMIEMCYMISIIIYNTENIYVGIHIYIHVSLERKLNVRNIWLLLFWDQ